MKIEPLLSPLELKIELPITSIQKDFIETSRYTINKILDKEDSRLLLIIGPCSIHDKTAAKEFAQKLAILAKEVSDTFFIVMRVYFEKPRTTIGWKGFLYDPHLNESHDIATGIRWTRQLLLDLADMEIPCATEFLDPASALYFEELISWGCIGARTSASQTHRQIASSLSLPIAFKNSTDGNLDVAIDGIISSGSEHSFIGLNETGVVSIVRSRGNPHGHIVLRGAELQTNYDPQSLSLALKVLKKAGLPERLLIDCSHGNSCRKHEQQSVVFQSIIHQFLEGNESIRGALIESHLFGGNQKSTSDSSQLEYGVSITDPCLDWINTESLIKWGHAKLTNQELCYTIHHRTSKITEKK